MEVEFEKAYNVLMNGDILGVATDTVYGFATTSEYISKLYDFKKRPTSKKIVKIIYDIRQIGDLDDITFSELQMISKKYWPGNNTLIFLKNGEFESFRIPDEDTLINFLKVYNLELYVTSANLSGEIECMTKKEFLNRFPNIPLLKNKKEEFLGKPSNVYKILKNKTIKER